MFFPSVTYILPNESITAEYIKSPSKLAFHKIETVSSRVAIELPEFWASPPTLAHWEVLGILSEALPVLAGYLSFPP